MLSQHGTVAGGFDGTCTDLRRREQLAQWRKRWARQSGRGPYGQPLEIVKGAIKEAKLSASDVILVDTAGRLHIDDDLMNELSMLKKELQPAKCCSLQTR